MNEFFFIKSIFPVRPFESIGVMSESSEDVDSPRVYFEIRANPAVVK